MGSIISNDDTIDKLIFKKLKKGKVVKCKKLVVVDDYNAIVELEDGSYTVIGRVNSINANYAMLNYGTSNPSKLILFGLVNLGVITKEAATNHINQSILNTKLQNKKYYKNMLEKACTELGIDVPKVI